MLEKCLAPPTLSSRWESLEEENRRCSGEVERREKAVAQQKSVVDACSIGVQPYDVAFGVTRLEQT
jgi:hypothetical protein